MDYIDNYKKFANAVVEKAAMDYRRSLRRLRTHPEDIKAQREKNECELFFHDGVELYTDVDGPTLMRKIKERVYREVIRMHPERLDKFKRNKRELKIIERKIEKLKDKRFSVPEVAGKVTKSGDEFPYIEEHMTVLMAEPKKNDKLEKEIKLKEAYRNNLVMEISDVENFIDSLPEGIGKEILETVYLEGNTLSEAGEILGYSKGRLSQIIKGIIKD